jgi:hypothetical protein
MDCLIPIKLFILIQKRGIINLLNKYYMHILVLIDYYFHYIFIIKSITNNNKMFFFINKIKYKTPAFV